MKRPLLIFGIVVGVLLALGPYLGALITLLGMRSAFRELGSSGISDPQALSASIGDTLVGTAAGLFAWPIGIVILIVCIVLLATDKREPAPPPLPPV